MNTLLQEFDIQNEDELPKVASFLLDKAKESGVLLLVGDLGAGKTTLTKYIVQNQMPGEQVTSPTFTLVNKYQKGSFVIHHFDLYRLKDEEEIFEIGLEDALAQGLVIIEWPEIAFNYLPSEFIITKITTAENNHRKISVYGYSK